jgi:hypothetical protein
MLIHYLFIAPVVLLFFMSKIDRVLVFGSDPPHCILYRYEYVQLQTILLQGEDCDDSSTDSGTQFSISLPLNSLE